MLVQRRFLLIHGIDDDAIQPEIRHKSVFPIRRKTAPMGVRAILTTFDDFGPAFMIDHCGWT